MAVKQKTSNKKIKSNDVTSPGALRKIARNEANIARHEKNVRLADYFGIVCHRGSLSKAVRKSMENLKVNNPDRWLALNNGLAS